MLRVTTAALIAAVAALPCAPRASAEDCNLTLERALEIARERAPAVVAARTRIDEARARLDGASLLLRENPELEAAAGPRRGPEEDTDVHVKLSQALELGGARAARIAGAEAGIAHRRAAADESVREVQLRTAAAFLGARAAVEEVALAERAEGLADELRAATERRHRAGDVAILDVNVARAALARARADAAAARAARHQATGRLVVVLNRAEEPPPHPCGPLRAPAAAEIAELLRAADDRADLRAIAAEIDEAEAARRLGAARAWPALKLGGEYKREEGDQIYLGGFSISLPLFERGQSAVAEAVAREQRLRAVHDAAERAVSAEVRTAWEVYRERESAARELASGLPLLEDSESLARRSYDAGELSLAELLAVRRETLDIRRDSVARSLEAALAGVELQATAGVLR